jgi:hypothetical protein
LEKERDLRHHRHRVGVIGRSLSLSLFRSIVDPFLREEEEEGRKLQNKFPPPFLREKEKTGILSESDSL